MISDTTTLIQITNWTPLSAPSELPNSTVVYAISGCYPSETYKDTIYIGSAKECRRRLTSHYCDLRNGHHPNPFLQNAFNKHKDQKWVIGVIEECEVSVQLEREQYYLDTLQPFVDCAGGFNVAKSSTAPTLGRKHTDETKAKMSATKRGKKKSPETLAKMSASNKGRKVSAETRAKMSAVKKGKPSNCDRTGMKHSQETKAKLSKLRKEAMAREELERAILGA